MTTTTPAPPTTSTTGAIIYTRISADDLKLGRGVLRQLEDLRERAQQHLCSLIAEFSDNDLSAFSGGHRPGYQALLTALEDACCHFAHVILFVQHSSRLWRNRKERSAGIELFQRLGINVVAINGPALDFSTSGGRFLSDLLGAFDTAESEVKSERLQDESRKRAERGAPHGRAPYGWKRLYETDASGRVISSEDIEDPVTGPVVRDVVKRIVAGEALSRIAKDFNQRGLPCPGFLARRRRPGDEDVQSNTWVGITLKQMALRDANIGQRLHRGQVVGKATWPPLVSEDDHMRVKAILTAPERHRHRDGKRKWLLTHGVGRCGVCGSDLGSRNKYGHPVYRCAGPGCTTRRVEQVDPLVDQWMVRILGEPDAAAAFDTDDVAAQQARDRAAAITAKLAVAADQFSDDVITAEQLARITQRLRPELEAAQADMRKYQRPNLPANMAALLSTSEADRKAAWDAMEFPGKRNIMLAMNVEVVIMPMAKSGPNSFDPLEIDIRFAASK